MLCSFEEIFFETIRDLSDDCKMSQIEHLHQADVINSKPIMIPKAPVFSSSDSFKDFRSKSLPGGVPGFFANFSRRVSENNARKMSITADSQASLQKEAVESLDTTVTDEATSATTSLLDNVFNVSDISDSSTGAVQQDAPTPAHWQELQTETSRLSNEHRELEKTNSYDRKKLAKHRDGHRRTKSHSFSHKIHEKAMEILDRLKVGFGMEQECEILETTVTFEKVSDDNTYENAREIIEAFLEHGTLIATSELSDFEPEQLDAPILTCGIQEGPNVFVFPEIIPAATTSGPVRHTASPQNSCRGEDLIPSFESDPFVRLSEADKKEIVMYGCESVGFPKDGRTRPSVFMRGETATCIGRC